MNPRWLVVDYATGGFVRYQDRLRTTCEAVGQTVACYDIGDTFMSHEALPYFFKVEAMLKASKLAPVLLWADSVVYASGTRPLDPIFEHIEKEGYYLQNQGWNNAQWCNDASLKAFGFTRDEAEQQCQVLGGLWGVSLDHPMGQMILNQLCIHRDLFRGAWNNQARTESSDPRCLGHRHDQSVLSLLAAKCGLKTPHAEDNMWCCYADNKPEYILNIGRGGW